MKPETAPSSPPASPRRVFARWLGWYAMGNAALLLLIGWRYVQISGRPDTAAAALFLPLTWLGHFASLALLAVLPAWLLALAWPRKAAVVPLAVAASTIVVILTTFDALVFNLYRFHLNGMVWSLFANGGLTEIVPITAGTWLILAGIALALVLLECGLAVAARRWIRAPRRGGRAVAAALLLILVAGNLLHAWADASNRTAITKMARNFPAYQPLSARKFMKRLGLAVAERDPIVRIKAAGTSLNYPRQPIVATPPAQPLNVLVLVIDAWRYDMLTEQATPNLWALARRSQQFTHHNSAANSTRFGIFTLFYGLCGSYWHAMLAEQRGPVLVHQMLKEGYQFGIFGSARLTSPEFDRTVFSEVRDRIPLQTPAPNVPARDQEINRRFVEFLDRRDPAKPFLGFLFYDGSHSYSYPKGAPEPFQPVSPPIAHLELGPGTDPVPVRNRFLNAVHAVDVLAGEALARLEKEHLLSNTVVVCTGDHGQEFNDTGGNFWGHNSNFSKFQTDVPLIVYWPGRAPAVFNHATSHLDIAPTLMQEALGCTVPPAEYSNGRSLFDPAPRQPIVAATWGSVGLVSPGRVDVMADHGTSAHYDENYREIATPVPPQLIGTATREMSRFYAR